MREPREWETHVELDGRYTLVDAHADLLGDPADDDEGERSNDPGRVGQHDASRWPRASALKRRQREADALDRLDKVRVEAVAELGNAGGDLVEPGDEE
jgi:hypothetical protein